jgi:hypothetical protein
VSGHGFEVTGDPADLPPGTKLIPLDITGAVEHVARALYEQVRGATTGAPEWEGLHPMEQHNMRELALTAVHALTEEGWHPASAHDAIAQAMADDNRPHDGLDPR